MKNKELKLFVGGYYDNRIFNDEQFEGKTPFSQDVDIYTLNEVLELEFVKPVKDWYEDQKNKKWDDTTEDEKIESIISYVDTDEIAGLMYFNTEKEAKNFKENIIKEIKEIEKMSFYKGKKQDNQGYFREVYTSK